MADEIKTLYIGNLSYQSAAESLRAYYEPYGPVKDVRVVEGKGFGFVEIPAENMQAAIDATDGKPFEGRTLRVSEAQPREDRRPRSNNGGNRRW